MKLFNLKEFSFLKTNIIFLTLIILSVPLNLFLNTTSLSNNIWSFIITIVYFIIVLTFYFIIQSIIFYHINSKILSRNIKKQYLITKKIIGKKTKFDTIKNKLIAFSKKEPQKNYYNLKITPPFIGHIILPRSNNVLIQFHFFSNPLFNYESLNDSCFNIIILDNKQNIEKLIEHPNINGIIFVENNDLYIMLQVNQCGIDNLEANRTIYKIIQRIFKKEDTLILLGNTLSIINFVSQKIYGI